VALDPGLVVARRRVVPADGHALGERAVTARAEGAPEAGQGTVGHDHVAGAQLTFGARLAVAHGCPLALGQRSALGRLAEDGCECLGALEDRGSRLGRTLDDDAVEVVTGDGVAVVGEMWVLGPAHLEGLAEAVGPQTVVTVRPLELVLHPHVGQLAHRARGEAVAAGLDPGEVFLLDERDVPAGIGEPIGAGGARRAATDDEHVVDVGRSRTVTAAARPGRGPAVGALRRRASGLRPGAAGCRGRA